MEYLGIITAMLVMLRSCYAGKTIDFSKIQDASAIRRKILEIFLLIIHFRMWPGMEIV